LAYKMTNAYRTAKALPGGIAINQYGFIRSRTIRKLKLGGIIVRGLAALIMLISVVSVWIIVPALANDFNAARSCNATNPADGYCVYKGGCPEKGYCYFPDGSYVLSWSLYDDACRECYRLGLSDRGAWLENIYGYLYSVDCHPVVSLKTATNRSQGVANNTSCPSCS